MTGMQVTVTHEELCERFAKRFPLEYEVCLQAASIDKVTQSASSLEAQFVSLSERTKELEAELLEATGGKATKPGKVTRLAGATKNDPPAEPGS